MLSPSRRGDLGEAEHSGLLPCARPNELALLPEERSPKRCVGLRWGPRGDLWFTPLRLSASPSTGWRLGLGFVGATTVRRCVSDTVVDTVVARWDDGRLIALSEHPRTGLDVGRSG